MRRIAFWMALAMGALELGSIPTMLGPDDFWPAAALFGVLFLVSAWWLRRSGGRGPAILLIVLFGIELLFLPTYSRSSALDWALQGGTLVFSGIGIVAAIGSLSGVRPRGRVPANG